MKNKEFHIIGSIIDQTGQGVQGLRIEAWDKDLIFDDLVGRAKTDTKGFFEIKFTEI